MKIAVLGAGAWGTAMACHAAGRHEVVLWARDAAQAQQLVATRKNDRYLPGNALPASLHVSADLSAASAHGAQGLIVIASPVSALRERLQALPQHGMALWLCKGLEAGTGALGHEIAASVRPHAPSGVLSGPSFALEVARGQPTALVVASADAELRECAVAAFHTEALRVYTSDDPTGVEVGGAMKNVLAIAAGILDGLAQSPSSHAWTPGLNARAALITRGLAEMTRLGVAMGAQADTFMGLSGLGDLVLTATGALSRNRQVGLLLAQGHTLAEALASLGHVAEGVYTAATLLGRGRQLNVELPITQAVVDVLQGRLAAADAVGVLMTRGARSESAVSRRPDTPTAANHQKQPRPPRC